MFDSVKTKPVSTSLSGKQNYSTVPAKLKKLQREWQVNINTYISVDNKITLEREIQ